eukprot:tig00020610_g12065.t1
MRSLAVITGGSQGFGRAFAAELARAVPATDFALLARNAAGMRETEAEIKAASPSSAVHIFPIDLGDLSTLEAKYEDVLSKLDPTPYSRAILLNNAGIIGDQVNVRDYKLATLRANIDLSVTSMTYVTARFLAKFAPLPPAPARKVVVVHVSSLAALQPFGSWGQYCTGRAARDMLHRAVASEEKDAGTSVRTLNYAPGPMDTAMTRAVRESDVPLQKVFKDMHEKGQMVDPYASAKKLVGLVEKDEFESGAHLDYFDV